MQFAMPWQTCHGREGVRVVVSMGGTGIKTFSPKSKLKTFFSSGIRRGFSGNDQIFPVEGGYVFPLNTIDPPLHVPL